MAALHSLLGIPNILGVFFAQVRDAYLTIDFEDALRPPIV
jgi:hypothetical protein